MTNAVTGAHTHLGELTVEARAEDIVTLATFLRDDPRCRFTTLIDICGVDYPDRLKRFDVVYHFLSMQLNQRVRVKVQADEQTPVPTITSVHPSANWFERE